MSTPQCESMGFAQGGNLVSRVVRSILPLALPLTLLVSLFPGTQAAFAAGYSASLSSPTPPTPASTFVWSVSGASPSGKQQIDTVFLSGCWNAGQIRGAVASSGMVSINKAGTISVSNLSDNKLPLTVTVTFLAVYQSRTSGSSLDYKAGPTTTSLAVGGPNCQPPVDLSITDAAAASVVSGTNLTYTLGYANTSSTAAENVQVKGQVPAGTAFVSATGGATPDNAGTITWSLGTLAAHASGSFTVVVTVTATSGTLTNTATISTTSGELTTANNTASAGTTIALQADLSATVSDGVTTATPGTAITYSIVVANNGPSVANGAKVTDTLPNQLSNATWTCSASGGGSCGAGSGSGSINTTVNLPSGATATFALTASIDPAATGTVTNTVSVSPPSGESDSISSNNTASDTDTLSPRADLSITKSDGTTTAAPGGSTMYTIVVSNNGPSTVTGASMTDTLPGAVTGASWTCAASAGGACAAASGSDSVNTTVNLAPAATATFSVTAAIDPSATGSLANTATVMPPTGVTDPNPDNNTATDTDTLSPQADISVTVTDGVQSAVPGTATTYTIAVTNNGPSTVAGAAVADALPSGLSNASWTCSTVKAGDSCASGSGTGDINTKVILGPGDSANFSLTASIASLATGTLSNTATVAPPAGTTDTISTNNVSTDTNSLTPQVDLAITVDDGSSSAIPGTPVSYKVSVINAGPSDVTGAGVTMTSGGLLNTTLVCDASATVSGLTATVNVAAGGVSVCTLTGQVDSSATGSATVQGSVAPPTGVTDANTGNNSASDTDTLAPQADVSIVKTSSVSSAQAGSGVSYQIVVSNAGPSAAPGVSVTDTLPTQLTGVTWTCTPTSGASCASASGSGNIGASVDLGPGASASATFALSATIDASFSGPLSNMASVTIPAGVTDPTLNDNSSTATITVTDNDFSISASPGSLSIVQGSSGTSDILTAVTSGSAGMVNLSVSVSPAGPTASLNLGSVTAGNSATLTVNVGSSVAAGSYTVTVTGTEGVATHSTTVAVTVTSSGGGTGNTNGGFETGSFAGWTVSGTTSIVSSGAHSGTTPDKPDRPLPPTGTAPSLKPSLLQRMPPGSVSGTRKPVPTP